MLYLTPSEKLKAGVPSGRDNLLDLYNLQTLASSVARVDPVTGAKRKLRKSYKNHIADLPGKHVIPQREEAPSLVGFARKPPTSGLEIAPIKSEMLQQIRFSRSPQAGIPGFDAKLFATAMEPEKKKREREQGGEERAKTRARIK